MIDQMAGAGIVGEYKGSQAREVMMTLDQWDALQKQVADDLSAGYEADQMEGGMSNTDRGWIDEEAESPSYA